MDIAIVLIGRIDAIRASSDSDACGCWISCAVPLPLLLSFTVYPFRRDLPVGALHCASHMCQGGRGTFRPAKPGEPLHLPG